MSEHHIHKDVVQVSEDSRREAHAPIEVRLLAKERLWSQLSQEKKELEGELSKYSPAAFSSAQRSIRGKFAKKPQKSFAAWMAKKAEMEQRRTVLVEGKIVVEQQMEELKPEIKKLRQEQSEAGKSVLQQILEVLVQIKDMVEQQIA